MIQMSQDIAYVNITFRLEYVRLHGTTANMLSGVEVENVDVTSWYKAGAKFYKPGILEGLGQHAAGYSALLTTYSEALELHPIAVKFGADKLNARLKELANSASDGKLAKERDELQICRARLIQGGLPSLYFLPSKCSDVIDSGKAL
jgi:hypothetical protein